MEGISAAVCAKMKRYWKRQGYHRISGGSSARIRRAELGGGRRRRRRMSWRIKIKPKIKLNSLVKPNKFVVWLRDAYVRMMLGFANSAAGGMVGDGVSSLGRKAVKEYEEKAVILEIYKSLVLAPSNRHH
ncbi:unnamed protein product [Linum tenue]|uniref:Uncharacterized protein n=1 Tax=Linum tenue TaxID=586396 RepID=A0AAV0LZB1_9ROSI|nr:unnamed protein product [Linum tenue]